MKVRVLFIHPENGLQDVTVQNAQSVDEVKSKLTELGCAVLTADEEK